MNSDFTYWLMNSEFAHGMATGAACALVGLVAGYLMFYER